MADEVVQFRPSSLSVALLKMLLLAAAGARCASRVWCGHWGYLQLLRQHFLSNITDSSLLKAFLILCWHADMLEQVQL